MGLRHEDKSIRIAGDGVAVGNNNRITVIKQGDRRSRDSRDSTEPSDKSASAMLAAAVAALVYGAHQFARHADGVYVSLVLVAVLTSALALGTSWLAWRLEAWEQFAKACVMAAVAMLAATGVAHAHEVYPRDLIALSLQADGAHAFICSLNAYGRQVALTHAIAAIAGFGAGLLLLLSTAGLDATRLWRGEYWSAPASSWIAHAGGACLMLVACAIHWGPAAASTFDLPSAFTVLACGGVR